MGSKIAVTAGLAKLDELYERGAIGERDYERRKQQILDEV